MAYLGRFSSEKNPKAVLQMAQELRDENIYFLMGGKGPMFDEVLCEIKNKGLYARILTPGIINTVDALQTADVMVLPSTLDGRPNAVLEAMASSVPVIASAVGGLPTIIEHEKNGFLVKPENVDEFVNYILKLKNTPGLKQQIGIRALEYAQQVLDDKFMLNTYKHTIEQVLK